MPVWRTHLSCYPSFADRHYAAEGLAALQAQLPRDWLTAARAAHDNVQAGHLPLPSADPLALQNFRVPGWPHIPLVLTACPSPPTRCAPAPAS